MLLNSFLYVLSASAKAIDVLALNAPGQASHIQTFQIAPSLQRVGITVDGDRVQGMAVFVKAH
jgi:hypothetical protein